MGGVHFYFGYGRNQNGPGNHSFYRRGESLLFLVTCILVTILGLVMFWLRNLRIWLRFGYGACDLVTIWLRTGFGYVLVTILFRFGYELDHALDFCTLWLRFGDAFGCETAINCKRCCKNAWSRFGYAINVLVTFRLRNRRFWLRFGYGPTGPGNNLVTYNLVTIWLRSGYKL